MEAAGGENQNQGSLKVNRKAYMSWEAQVCGRFGTKSGRQFGRSKRRNLHHAGWEMMRQSKSKPSQAKPVSVSVSSSSSSSSSSSGGTVGFESCYQSSENTSDTFGFIPNNESEATFEDEGKLSIVFIEKSTPSDQKKAFGGPLK
jgi:hypothetical protein